MTKEKDKEIRCVGASLVTDVVGEMRDLLHINTTPTRDTLLLWVSTLRKYMCNAYAAVTPQRVTLQIRCPGCGTARQVNLIAYGEQRINAGGIMCDCNLNTNKPMHKFMICGDVIIEPEKGDN